jgi:hypothetical protein
MIAGVEELDLAMSGNRDGKTRVLVRFVVLNRPRDNRRRYLGKSNCFAPQQSLGIVGSISVALIARGGN